MHAVCVKFTPPLQHAPPLGFEWCRYGYELHVLTHEWFSGVRVEIISGAVCPRAALS